MNKGGKVNIFKPKDATVKRSCVYHVAYAYTVNGLPTVTLGDTCVLMGGTVQTEGRCQRIAGASRAKSRWREIGGNGVYHHGVFASLSEQGA